MASTFREALIFLDKLGVYEVVIPFLLVFTTVYAILEKSKVFGLEEISGVMVTRKNLNSMFAFVTAFLVIASTQLVAAINEAIANMVLLLLLAITFLILVGTFHTGTDEFKLADGYVTVFSLIFFVGIVLIFLHAIKTADGTPWLMYIWGWIIANMDSGAFGALVLTIGVIAIMFFVTSSGGGGIFKKKKDGEH